MRDLSELLVEDSAWPQVQEWLFASDHVITVVPNERAEGEQALQRLQVTTRSTLGSIA